MRYKRYTASVSERLFLEKEAVAAAILLLAIFFNAAFAIVNGHLMPLSRLHVSLMEAAITGLAISHIALNFRSSMLPWTILLALILLLHLVLSFANQAVNPKFVRDVIDIPIFIALGMVYARGNLVRLFFYIQLAVLVLLLLELVDVDTYSKIFNIQDYYVNTRDFKQDDFYNTDSTLFVSATRPSERFVLEFLGLHRGSSIFLEPVSLGNYCIIATIFTVAFWRDMSRMMRVFFVVSIAIMIVGSDGRLAAVTCVIIVLGSSIFPLLPRYSNVLFLPGVVLLGILIVYGLALRHPGGIHTGATFSDRLSGSIEFLESLDTAAVFGFDAEQAKGRAWDSGISYFVITQSVVGVAILWLFVCLVPRYQNRTSIFVIYGICAYIPLNLLVSYSLFSIKTAAPMWFLYGYVVAASRPYALEARRYGPSASRAATKLRVAQSHY